MSCAHPPLNPDKTDATRWLKTDSGSHQALRTVVLDKSLIKALDQMTEAKHTGALEFYHSLLLKYCEKRNHFSKEGMFVRTALAALDNNYNVGRFQARTNSGDPRYKVVYPKGRKDWVAKPITETKSYNYLAPMVHKVIEAWLSDPSAPPVVQPPQHPGNIAPIPRPPKHDIIAKYKSRFF